MSKIDHHEINELKENNSEKFQNLKKIVPKTQFWVAGNRTCTVFAGGTVPNQRNRKKKQGTNKIKKTRAMRAKEAEAKPRKPPSATGKGVRETSKRDIVKDRPGGFSRA
jgi:hypothetical protein